MTRNRTESSEALTAARCIRIGPLEMDMVLFILTGLPCGTLLSDLRARSMANLKKKLQVEVDRLGNRVDEFTTDLSNIRELALKYAWGPRDDYTIPTSGGKGKLPAPV